MTEQPPEVTRTPIEGLGYWVRRRQPALFPGAIPPDVCAMWSPDVIRRAGGDVVVRVEKSDVGTQVPALGGSWGRFDRVHQSLGSVVDALDAQGPPYLYACPCGSGRFCRTGRPCCRTSTYRYPANRSPFCSWDNGPRVRTGTMTPPSTSSSCCMA